MGRLPSDPRARDGAVLVAPAVLAAVLCWIQIDGRSLGFDEAATVTIASQHGSALWSAIAHDGGNMSGYYLLLHVLIAAFGNGLTVLRVASAVASTATVVLIAAIGLRLFGRTVALAAGVLAAVSLPLVFWAQNARGYAPMVALVCGAFLALISLAAPAEQAAGESAPRSRRRAWIAWVVLMTLALYSSFVAVLVVPAQLALVWPRRLRARFLIALACVGGACLPLVVLATSRGSSQLFWVPRPTFMTETQVLQSLTSAGMEPSFHATVSTTGLMLATIAVVLGIAAVIAWRARRSPSGQWGPILVLAWILIPSVLAWLVSFVTQPIFVPRNLLMSVPPVALLLAVGLSDRRLPRAVAIAAFVAAVGLRGEQVVAGYGVAPEPWGQSTAYVLGHARPGDCVAFYPEDGRMAFQYYVGTRPGARARAPRSILPVARWGQVRPYVEDYASLSAGEIARRRVSCRRLWFVSSHEGQPDGPAQSLANRARFERLRAALQAAFGPGPVRQFGYASAIHVQLLPGRR